MNKEKGRKTSNTKSLYGSGGQKSDRHVGQRSRWWQRTFVTHRVTTLVTRVSSTPAAMGWLVLHLPFLLLRPSVSRGLSQIIQNHLCTLRSANQHPRSQLQADIHLLLLSTTSDFGSVQGL